MRGWLRYYHAKRRVLVRSARHTTQGRAAWLTLFPCSSHLFRCNGFYLDGLGRNAPNNVIRLDILRCHSCRTDDPMLSHPHSAEHSRVIGNSRLRADFSFVIVDDHAVV